MGINNKHLIKRTIAGLMAGVWTLAASLPAFALTTITTNTTWTDTGSGITLNDSLRINSGVTLRIISSDGVNGGNLTINLPSTGVQYTYIQGILNLSAQASGGNGGNLVINALGGNTTYNLMQNGSILSNGLGSGNGGNISSNVQYNYLINSTIQAMGGATGAGGTITLTDPAAAGASIAYVLNGSSLDTTGLAAAGTDNIITIEADAIYIDGQVVADGTGNSAGGEILMTSKNGRIIIEQNGDVLARGSGSGSGGNVELAAGLGATGLNIANCTSCNINSGALIQIDNVARINVAGGGSDSGTIRIGRSNSGNLVQNVNNFNNNQIQGAGTVTFGGDTNTTSITISNYDQGTDFNGTNADIVMDATGAIAATSGNNFDAVTGISNTGDIDITDTTGGMTVSVEDTSGTSTLTAQSSGTIDLINSDATGRVDVYTDGAISGATGNSLSGSLVFAGEGGIGNSAGAMSFTNAGATDINNLEASSANIMATGGGAITLDNADISGTTTLQTDGSINALTGNTFGGSVFINGDGGITDRAGAVTLVDSNALTIGRIVSSSADLTATTSATDDLLVSNADVTGTTTLNAGNDLFAYTNNAFGNITANANGNLYIFETSNINVNSVTNTSASGATILYSFDGSVIGKGTAVADVNTAGAGLVYMAAGNNAADTGSYVNINANHTGTGAFYGLAAGSSGGTAITLRGNYGGNLIASGMPSIGTPVVGDIVFGDATDNIDVTGTTTFYGSTQDVTGLGVFGGNVNGYAGRIGFESTSGDFSTTALTASSATGWSGDESLIVVTRNGDITGSGYQTTGAANMRLQAGSSTSQIATNNINVTNVTAGQNLSLYATGDDSGAGTGTAINIGGTSSVAGNITATNIDASNYFSGLNGDVDITLSSGDLETAMVWTNGDVDFTASNGSITQDTSHWGTGYTNGKTIYAAGDVNLTASGNSGSHINTGVSAWNSTSDVTLRAQGRDGSDRSVVFQGYVGGNMDVAHTGGGNTTGEVYLGTSVGDVSNLNDVNTVTDVVGTTTVQSVDDVYLYGSFKGAVDVTGRSLTGVVDKGALTIANINTTKTVGTAVDLYAVRGAITGANLTTAGGSNTILQAGTDYLVDKTSYVNLSGVNIGGDLTVTVSGSTTGGTSGDSITVTGSVGGTSTGQHTYDDIYLGNVSMP